MKKFRFRSKQIPHGDKQVINFIDGTFVYALFPTDAALEAARKAEGVFSWGSIDDLIDHITHNFDIIEEVEEKPCGNKVRESKEVYFLKMAKHVATRATCPRREVGCVIVDKNGHIKATGYNGVPRGHVHCIDHPCGGQNMASSTGLNFCMATHAEQNALLQCHNVMEIDTIYVTTSPCVTCAKLIANTSCKTVVYAEEYNDAPAFEILRKSNIKAVHVRI